MQRTRIKICGITNRDDAMCAVDHGADAIGFIFVAKSPRSIETDKAASIIASLPAYVTTVGVIVNETLEAANAVAANTGVQLLQCHGDEDETYCEQLATPYVKVIRLDAVSAIRPYESRYPGATALMLEKHSDKAYGGTGETLVWDEPAPYPGLILAGGLTPENVLTAVLDVRPYAVDVASGVERKPGLKDPRKIRDFVAAVQAADKECENE